MNIDSRPFVHLRVHSNYTLSGGISKVGDYLACVVENGQPALAVTDHLSMFGALGFSLKATEKGVQPIVGTKIQVELGMKTRGSVLLLAKDETGYRNVCEILRVCLDPARGKTDILSGADLSILGERSEGVVAITGVGGDSLIGRAIATRELSPEQIAQFVGYLATSFGGDFFLEVCRTGNPDDKQVEIEKAGLRMALDADVPIVGTSDVWYARDEKRYRDALDIMNAIAADRKASLSIGPDGVEGGDPVRRHLRSSEEMRLLFADLPEAFENTLEIARCCGFAASKRKPILPPFVSPDGRSEDDQLREIAVSGLNDRLRKAPQLFATREEYEARLDYELSVIGKMGFPGYFLIVADFISWSHARNIPVGLGRGSGAGSLVAWSLGITGLDPLQFGLLFERFLNPDRVSMPDFDIDFCGDRRGDVIDYVRAKYGDRQVAGIVTFGELKAKGAIRDASRVIVPVDGPFTVHEVNQIVDTMPKESTDNRTLRQLYEEYSTYRERVDSDPKVRTLHDMAMLIEGLYKSSSSHAAGVVIADKPLTDLVPVGHDPKNGNAIVQFNMKDAESAGLVKFDFLGLKTLTSMTLAVDYVEALTNERIDLDALAYDDPGTMRMLAAGNTGGVFQFESKGMQQAMLQVQPTRIEDLIAICALYRPGPMEMIPLFGERKQGAEVEYPAPAALTKPILEETFGIIVYQEQVMQIAREVAGYSLGEADLLRRAMGKKIRAEMDAQRERFVDGAVEKGLPRRQADEMFDLLAKFADYGFNKSHAAAYGVISYRTAWLKYHHPEAFYASLMSVEDKSEKIEPLVAEARSHGIEILQPDVNRSMAGFTVERTETGTLAIRFALTAVKGVSDVSALEEERSRSGPFKDVVDFHRRMVEKTSAAVMQKLAEVGAFDSLTDGNRRRTLEMLKHLGKGDRKKSREPNLFGAETTVQFPKKIMEIADWHPQDRAEMEGAAVGFFFSSHPLDVFEASMKAVGVKRLKSILDYQAASKDSLTDVRTFGLVTKVYVDSNADGRQRLNVTFSDKTTTTTMRASNKLVGWNGVDVQKRKQELDTIAKEKRPVIALINVNDYNGRPFVFLNDYMQVETHLESNLEKDVLRIDMDADFDLHWDEFLRTPERAAVKAFRQAGAAIPSEEIDAIRKRIVDFMVQKIGRTFERFASTEATARKLYVRVENVDERDPTRAILLDPFDGTFDSERVRENIHPVRSLAGFVQFGSSSLPAKLEAGRLDKNWEIVSADEDGRRFDIRRIDAPAAEHAVA